uniref:FA core complex associated protein 100 n=1 Tax=Xenopus tropicalis TaxID=8364 RepID=A0A6I8RQ86_XENTR
MPSVQYLAGFHCPAGGLAAHGAQLIPWKGNVYVSIGKSVYEYSMEKKCMLAVYEFATEIWCIELDTKTQQLYILCGQSGIYLLQWDEKGRLLKEPMSATSTGGVNIFFIGVEFCCLLDPSICYFTVCHEVLVAVSMNQNKWEIRLFNIRSSDHKGNYPSAIREMEISVKPTPGCRDICKGNSLPPVLLCVSLWKKEELAVDFHEFTIEPSLFTFLFGIDLAMVNSPVVICGFPDGQVVFFPLKTVPSPKSDFTDNQTKSSTRLPLLYNLEQPVVFLGATKAQISDGENNPWTNSSNKLFCDCILLLGQGGLMVTITAGNKAEGGTYEFREYHLKAPVKSAFCSGPNLYYSTCSDIQCVVIPQPGADLQNRILSYSSYNIPMIRAMSPISCCSEGDKEFLALSDKGKLMLFILKQSEDTAQRARLSCSQAGQRIKELLSQIASVSERASPLKSLIEQRNHSLLNLNKVVAISQAVLTSRGANMPVRCKVKPLWTRRLQQDCLVASCILENKTDFILESGWNLCIHLSTEGSGTSYSFSVMNLQPEENMEFIFPLVTEESEHLEFPIKITFALVYSLQELDKSSFQDPQSSLFSHTQSSICLPLQEHIIDILQCLRLKPHTGQPFPTTFHCMSPLDPVEAFLRSSGGAECKPGQPSAISKAICNAESNYAVTLVASVRVASVILHRALKKEDSDTSLCSLLFHWLLSAELPLSQNPVEVHGMTPNGREFRLRVGEVSAYDLSPANPIPATEVQIISPHLDALACLHLAVIRRLQILAEKCNQDGCISPEINLDSIQKQVIAREGSSLITPQVSSILALDRNTVVLPEFKEEFF